MATLPWTKLNPTVKFRETKKKYFNKFLYKAVVYLPGGRLILSNKFNNMEYLLENRLRYHSRYINYAGSWGTTTYNQARDSLITDADISQLEYWRDNRSTNPDILVRIEEPYINVYATCEPTLYKLVGADPKFRSLTEIHRPKNTESASALNRGEIILKRPTDYNYRVYIREGKYSRVVTRSIYELLINQGDDVKMTGSCSKNLHQDCYWMPSTYFYTKDLNVVTMINLINPDIIYGFFKLAKDTE